MKISRVRVLVATSIVAAVAGAAAFAERRLLPGDRVLPGVRIEGFPMPDAIARGDDATITAWLAARVEAVRERKLEVRAGKLVRTVSLRDALHGRTTAAELGRVVSSLRRLGHEGPLSSRIDVALRARDGAIDVPVPLAVDVEVIEKVAASLKAEIDEPPTDAKLDLAAHTVVPDHAGKFLDLDGAVAKIGTELLTRASHALRTNPQAPVPSEVLEPMLLEPIVLAVSTATARVTADALAKLDISTVVGTFETHFGRGGDQAPRATNIENAAKKLEGLVLQPGQLVSFNAVVGERSEANGFKTAWEIFKGEMRPGVGGGTCQVASTFHAAAFFGGLEILERLPHSRPSAYIPMGLDSTVVYPVVDLKVKNPHDFPVVVHTKIGANTLGIELLGKARPVNVVFARDVVDIFPFARKIEEEPWVKPGQAIKKQGGIRGYRVRRVRTMKYASGAPPKSEISYDFYPPTTEIYVVAPGTDPNELPAMPQDVLEMLAKKNGEPIPSPNATDAVACAGECAPNPSAPPKPAIEVKNGAGVHDPVGDQVAPSKSVSIAH